MQKKSILLIAIIVLIIVFLSGALYFFLRQEENYPENYQAVFLTNGQVYFGKISNEKNGYLDLFDVFYLQTDQNVQNQGKNTALPEVNLVKLGKEMHGPKDKMSIVKNNILFIEELGDDSKVVKAITEYNEK